MDTEKRRLDVRLTKGGVYPMYPVGADYRFSEKDGVKHEMIKVRFLVQLGSKFSCPIYKTIFYKDKDHIKKEVGYLLKFICPDLLEKAYNKSEFKDYAEALCSDLKTEFDSAMAAKRLTLLFGKLRKKKTSPYVDFEEHIPLSGDFTVNYLATPDDVGSLWYSEWELANMDVPFELAPPKATSNGVPVTAVDTFSTASDDLPF